MPYDQKPEENEDNALVKAFKKMLGGKSDVKPVENRNKKLQDALKQIEE